MWLLEQRTGRASGVDTSSRLSVQSKLVLARFVRNAQPDFVPRTVEHTDGKQWDTTPRRVHRMTIQIVSLLAHVPSPVAAERATSALLAGVFKSEGKPASRQPRGPQQPNTRTGKSSQSAVPPRSPNVLICQHCPLQRNLVVATRVHLRCNNQQLDLHPFQTHLACTLRNDFLRSPRGARQKCSCYAQRLPNA